MPNEQHSNNSGDRKSPIKENTLLKIFLAIALASIWAGLNWYIQDATTQPGLWKSPEMLIKNNLYRFLICFGASLAALHLLHRRLLFLLLLVNAVLIGTVSSYYEIFRRSLSWLTLAHQSNEGASVVMVGIELAAPYLLVSLPVLLFIWFTHRFLSQVKKTRRVLGAIGCILWGSVFCGLNLDHKPLKALEKFESADGIANVYGYAITWCAEFAYVNYDGVRAAALTRLEIPAEGMKKSVSGTNIGDRIVWIQVGSLDEALIDFKIRGKAVTPVLNQLASAGEHLALQSPKKNGSCDADFTMLYGGLPSSLMAPYRIPQFPFERSIVTEFARFGYDTSFYHGVSGNFFERRTAFSHMSFAHLNFREELLERQNEMNAEWTLEDGVVFRAAAKALEQRQSFFQFIVTGTSHTPFRFSTEGHPKIFFPEAYDRNLTYFDSIHYVDHAIGEYIKRLPNDTTVAIYGDHWSSTVADDIGYHSQVIDDFGLVPLLFFKTSSEGVKKLSNTPSKLANSGELKLVDFAAWFHESWRSSHKLAHKH